MALLLGACGTGQRAYQSGSLKEVFLDRVPTVNNNSPDMMSCYYVPASCLAMTQRLLVSHFACENVATIAKKDYDPEYLRDGRMYNETSRFMEELRLKDCAGYASVGMDVGRWLASLEQGVPPLVLFKDQGAEQAFTRIRHATLLLAGISYQTDEVTQKVMPVWLTFLVPTGISSVKTIKVRWQTLRNEMYAVYAAE